MVCRPTETVIRIEQSLLVRSEARFDDIGEIPAPRGYRLVADLEHLPTRCSRETSIGRCRFSSVRGDVRVAVKKPSVGRFSVPKYFAPEVLTSFMPYASQRTKRFVATPAIMPNARNT